MGGDRAPRAARAELRLGDLRRGRLDARAHPRHRRAARQGDAAQARRASDLRRGEPRGDRRGDARLRRAPAFATSSRCAAIRRAASTRPMSRRPTATSRPTTLVSAIKAIGDFEVSVSAYPEKHPQSPNAAARHRDAEAQGRRGRRPRDHAVLLRQQRLFPLPRRRRGGGDHDPDRAGDRAGAEFQADGQLRQARRRERAGLARRTLRGPRRRSRRPAASSPRRSAPSR